MAIPSILFLILLGAETSNAQYFGRNKVQYEDFNFQILETPHFDIYHYPREADAVKDMGRLSERWYQRHSALLGHTFVSRNPIIFYASHADFQQNDIVPGVGVGTGGVTEGLRNRVVLPFAQTNQSTNHVLGHELVHAFQYDIAKDTDKIGSIRATGQLPLWFIEGMAEYLSVGPKDSHTAMWLRDALQNEDLPTIEDLSNSAEYFPYRFGHSVWAFISGKWGDEIVPKLYVESANKGLEKGIEEVLGISRDSLSVLWNNSIRQEYSSGIAGRTVPDSVGDLVLGAERGTGGINAGPSLSPDGERVAFISEKNIFSMELYLADARTGEIIKKLSSTATDPHMRALHFIESAGSWSPEGDRFAAVVFARGDNQINIFNAENGKVLRKLRFDDVDALANPSWSPDGDKMIFSGSEGGYTDLYLYHLEEDSLVNLTGDNYSDLQPEWSPDGSQIAFVTDRGPDTSFETLTFGNLGIAIYNLDTGDIELLPRFEGAKHINPQFSTGGTSLYYISDYQGYSDVFRYDFRTGERFRVTNVSTGVSGISELSPALTIARETGDMMVTVFSGSNYKGYRIPEEQASGSPVSVSRPLASRSQASLPSSTDGGNNILQSYLNDPSVDLPPEESFDLSDYQPVLSLTHVGAGGGVGFSSSFGVGASGGVTMQFDDMLNQHTLITNLQVQGSYKDIGGQVSYLNKDHRFLYGASVSHFPFLSTAGSVSEDTVNVDGANIVAPVVNRINRRVFQDRLSLIGRYPLSITQRFDFSAGWTHIWYDLELERTFYNEFGQPFERTNRSLETPSPLNLYSVSAAYVEDNSIGAYNGPLSGHRLRFELSPTTGSLSYLSAVADYRRYFYLRPFTLAFRALHTGRYLQDSEDERLSTNFIGYEALVRGYNTNSFTARECTNSPGEGCAVYNRLIGSKMGIANVEFRIPFLGAEDVALFRSGAVPTVLSAFFDAGYAWTADDPFSFNDLKWTTSPTAERIPVFSAGASMRVNLLGYIPFELYYAVPFQRPGKSGYIGFTISQAW